MAGHYTLTEALFTGAVVTLLALVTPLAAEQAVQSAKLTACADKLRNVSKAEFAYADDNKAWRPMGEKSFLKEGGLVRAATYSYGMPPMMLIKGGYLKDKARPTESNDAMRARWFRCPEDEVNFVSKPTTGWREPYPTISYMFCWFNTQAGLKHYSYPCKTKADQSDDYGLRANLDRDDPGWYIYADLIKATSANLGALKDKAKSNHPAAVNCLYLGGHVLSHAVTEAQEKHVAASGNRFTLFFEDVQ